MSCETAKKFRSRCYIASRLTLRRVFMKILIILPSLIYIIIFFRSYKSGITETSSGNLLALIFWIIVLSTYVLPNRLTSFYVSGLLITAVSLAASGYYYRNRNKFHYLVFIILALASAIITLLNFSLGLFEK